MRVAIAALNAKYIHSSLAAACLAAACQPYEWEVMVREYTINQKADDILADLFSLQADVFCFSCYIWNIELIIRLICDLKTIHPGCCVVLGGPEASFDAPRILTEHREVDYIVRGEGERVLPQLLDSLSKSIGVQCINSISYRYKGNIVENPEEIPAPDLDGLPRPAYDSLHNLHNRVVYYEASRGCPFRCAYCLSARQPSVRLHSMARIKEDLLYLHGRGAKEIKFVDRTFNASEKRAMEIMEYLLALPGNVRCHFEIRAELISDRFIDFLKNVPPNRFFFEVGIQSTNPETLSAIGRKSDWHEVRKRILQIREETDIHLHLDLIAGLPFENYERFKATFNHVMEVRPHVIQLGFLKILKGSPLALDIHKYGYSIQQHPPYEILAAPHISYEELVMLHRIEVMLERYYNSGAYALTMGYIGGVLYAGNYFSFFEDLAWFWIKQDYFGRAHKREAEYSCLVDFFAENHARQRELANEFIKFDYLAAQGPYRMPANIMRWDTEGANERLYALLKDDNFVNKYLPHLRGINPGDRRRRVHLEYMNVDPDSGIECRGLPVLFVYPAGGGRSSYTISLQDHAGGC